MRWGNVAARLPHLRGSAVATSTRSNARCPSLFDTKVGEARYGSIGATNFGDFW